MTRFVFVALIASGCVRGAGAYECGSEAQCIRDGVQGRCEPVNVCSFPDPACPSGSRYGEYGGAYGDRCVGDEPPIDAGVDGAIDGHVDAGVDMMADGGTGCAAGYAALPGVTTHLYREVATAASWTTLRTVCSSDGANAYLAIPDDATELAALTTAAAADLWVGVGDGANEGTYTTVRGAPATFLPWEPGEPDNSGNQDCVAAIQATNLFETSTCSTMRVAICECEP